MQYFWMGFYGTLGVMAALLVVAGALLALGAIVDATAADEPMK